MPARTLAADRFARCLVLGLALLAAVRPGTAWAGEVLVPGGRDVAAGMLGVRPTPDAARFVPELVRVLFTLPPGRNHDAARNIERYASAVSSLGTTVDVVPLPLSSEFWDAVLARVVPASQLLAAILGDRAAALLCYGLAGLDEETLQYIASRPALARRLYLHPAVFAAFAGSLRIRAGRIAAPGAPRTDRWWESAVGAPLSDPEAFIGAWLETNQGRLAFLYDTIDQLEPGPAAFAIGSWLPESRAAERFATLVAATDVAARGWDIQRLPFSRQQYDVAALFWRVRTSADGTPAPPSRRSFWAQAFGGGDLRAKPDSAAAADPAAFDSDAPFDAAWLVETMFGVDGRKRTTRFGALTFAQRALADDRAAGDALTSVRGYQRFPYLMLALERIGVHKPSLFAAAARRADQIDRLDATRAYAALGQFQGALALVSRLVRVRSLDRAAAEALVGALVNVDFQDGWYLGGVARWLADELVPRLDAAYDTEHTLLAALGGASSPDGAEHRVTWEGQRYRLDLGEAERRRLVLVREKQGAVPIDVTLDVALVGRRVMSAALDASLLAGSIADLEHLAEDVRRDPSRSIAPDRVALPDAVAVMEQAVADLHAAGRDGTRAARAGLPLARLGDVMLAQSLVSMTYALYVGDPDGTILLAGDVSRRHDFGFGARDPDGWSHVAWGPPQVQMAAGVPWHVDGPVLAMDVALGALALRRINTERVLPAPVITMNERDTITAMVALMDPLALGDADRDRIVDAIAAGESRLASITGPGPAWRAMAEEVRLDGWRRRAAVWLFEHDRAALPSLFSLGEFLEWGGLGPERLAPWGTSAVQADACLCLEFVPAFHWRIRGGRPPLGLLATTVADLTLSIAVALRELRLPAALGQDVLRSAVQDFLDEVRPTDPDDWLGLVRGARAASPQRIEDYVAASAAVGPLVPIEP